MEMPRLGLTITDEMYEILRAEAEERGATIANLARDYLAHGMTVRGHKLKKAKVSWGGNRRGKQADEAEDYPP